MNSCLLWFYFNPFRSLFRWTLIMRVISPTSVGALSLTPTTSWRLLTVSSGQITHQSLTPATFLSLFIGSDCTERSFLCVFPAYVLTWRESVLSPSVQILVSIEWWQVSIIWKRMKAVSRSWVWKRSLSILAGRVTLGLGIVAANGVTFLINSQC